jgi:hypothetical protein
LDRRRKKEEVRLKEEGTVLEGRKAPRNVKEALELREIDKMKKQV